MTQKPDTALVKAAIKGGADSFTELCQRYYPAMVAIAHSILGVREAISKLSASARELIFLRCYDGMSYEQISAVLGISEQAINGRLRRAKKKWLTIYGVTVLARFDYEQAKK